MKIGCAILAGGKSSRMGTDKALLKIDGKNFIEQICGELLWFEEKLIARGNNNGFSESIETAWTVIPDVYPDHGPIGGIHAALASCESDALFVVTCDMPLLKEEMARKLCEILNLTADRKCTEMDQSECEQNLIQECSASKGCESGFSNRSTCAMYDAVIAVEANGKVHPLCGVYRKSALPILEEQILSGRNKVMAALERLQVKYVTIESSLEAQQLSNINTPLDYQKLNSKAE